MAIFRFRPAVLIPAASVVTNLLAGSKFEFLSRPSSIQMFASQDGTSPGFVALDFSLGNVVVGEDLFPNFTAVAGTIQRLNDGIGAGVGMAGDRIQIRARNSHATIAQGVTIMLDINEI